MNNKKKHYLITGGTGFVGSNLTDMLLKEGHKVTILTRSTSKAPKMTYPIINSEEYLETKNLNFEVYDGTHQSLVGPIMKADIVVHLAAAFIKNQQPDSVDSLIRGNILYTSQILSVIENHSPEVAFIGASTFSAFNGKGEVDPRNLYSSTKYVSELLSDSFKGVTRKAFLRFSDTYGYMDPRVKLHNVIQAKIVSGERDITLGVSPKQVMNMTHVKDVSRAIIEVSKIMVPSEKTKIYEVYNYGGYIQVEKLVELIAEANHAGVNVTYTREDVDELAFPNPEYSIPGFEFQESPLMIGETLRGNIH